MTDHPYRAPSDAESLPSNDVYRPRIGSLCSGYGGLDLALEAFTGGTTVWHVENDPAPSVILAARWREAPNYGDLTTLNLDSLPRVDWLTAGYPCQPFSIAGYKKGSADDRHLWPLVADAIGALRPRGVFLENVANHVTLGLDAVLWDLAALGYDARWGVVRASDAGAPHGRARVFIVATDARGEAVGQRTGLCANGATPVGWGRPDDDGASLPAADAQGDGRREGWTESARVVGRPDASLSGSAVPPDADGARPQGGEPAAGLDLPAWGAYEPAIRRWERISGRPAPRPTQPGRRSGERLNPAFVEWMMGIPAGWVTDVAISRNAQLKALGNGVVPQQAALALGLLVSTASAVAA